MASRIESLLEPLTIPRLKHLSTLLGLNTTGTKHTLRSRLVSLSPLRLKPTRILSIDMGIKNLAYCLLTISPGSKPTIVNWARNEVLVFPDPTENTISLPYFASTTHALAQRMLKDFKPSHILIEQQRWRTAGGAGVQEWTIRVNTLEAMLHAAFYGLAAGNVQFESVSPTRVANLWIPEDARKGTNSKTVKKGIVRGWISGEKEAEVQLGSSEEVKRKRDLLLWKQNGRKENQVPRTEVEKKTDDLADCVLQALAWLKWQENRSQLLKGVMPEGFEDVRSSTVRKVSPRRQKMAAKPKD
jgi:cruciform cutting endonuclease 1